MSTMSTGPSLPLTQDLDEHGHPWGSPAMPAYLGNRHEPICRCRTSSDARAVASKFQGEFTVVRMESTNPTTGIYVIRTIQPLFFHEHEAEYLSNITSARELQYIHNHVVILRSRIWCGLCWLVPYILNNGRHNCCGISDLSGHGSEQSKGGLLIQNSLFQVSSAYYWTAQRARSITSGAFSVPGLYFLSSRATGRLQKRTVCISFTTSSVVTAVVTSNSSHKVSSVSRYWQKPSKSKSGGTRYTKDCRRISCVSLLVASRLIRRAKPK